MNFLISIAGPSGVGKTTMANMLLSISDYNSSIIISGDDAHKWERKSKNWQVFTHLNPEANNLHEDYIQLLSLKNNNTISRKHYNHSNGLFDQPEIIEPKNTIIYEGLHALYLEELRNIVDLKIYIDTDEELKIAWKLKRDLNKRGYTETQILETIKKRLNDEKNFILPQKQYADVIAKFTFDEIEGVNFEFNVKNNKFFNLFKRLENFYNVKKQFIKVCKTLSENEDLIQNKGGNLSCKYDNKMLITSSGFELKNVSMFEGVCITERKNINNIIYKHGRPSMESLVHSHFKDCVIHTHPFYLMSILCVKNSKSLIKKLYKNYNFDYIKYVPPGFELYKQIKNCSSDIVFCQNHGLFVNNIDLEKCLIMTKEINEIAKQFIIKNTKKQEKHSTNKFLFPDSVILNEHNKSLNNSIFTNIVNCDLKPKFLNNKEIKHILNMEEEKYRSSI